MSSSNTSNDLVLEDINTGQKFHLPHNKSMFTCGRKKTNEIVTSSILASREHCIFLRHGTQLNVIDPESANGIFINGVLQQRKTMVTLKINDIIGLGCADIMPTSRSDPTNHTVYVLKEFEPPVTVAIEDMKTNLVEQPLDDTVKPLIENKRRLARESLDDQVPFKIPKVQEKSPILITHKKISSRRLSESGVPSKIPQVSPVPDIIDITDDNNPDEEMKIVENVNSHRSDPQKIVQNQQVILSNEKNPEDEVMSTSTVTSHSFLMDDDKMSFDPDTPTNFRTPEIEKYAERGNNQCRPTVISIATSPSFKTKEGGAQSTIAIEETTLNNGVSRREHSRKGESRSEKVPPVLSDLPLSREKVGVEVGVSSKCKEQILSMHGQGTCSRSTDDDKNSADTLLNLKGQTSNADGDDEHFFASPLNLDELNLHDRILSDNCGMEIVTNEQNLAHVNDNGVDRWIKYEPELDILDVDESLYTDMIDSADSPARMSSKLKRDKQESKTRFSELDIVTLSDDEDDFFFPASQLFGDEPEHDEGIKIEPTNGDIEEHEKEPVDDDRNDYPDIIVLSDSEDEADQWYDRLMGSQLNESREFHMNGMAIKREPEEINFVEAENIAKDVNRDSYDSALDSEQTEETISYNSKQINKRKRAKSVTKMDKLVEESRMSVEETQKHLEEPEKYHEISEKHVREPEQYLKESTELIVEQKKKHDERQKHGKEPKKHIEMREKCIKELAASENVHEDRKTDKNSKKTTGQSDHRRESTETKSYHSKRSHHRTEKKSTNKSCDIEDVKGMGHMTKSKNHEKGRISGEAKNEKMLNHSNRKIDSANEKSNDEKNLEKNSSKRSSAIQKGNARTIEEAKTSSIAKKGSLAIEDEISHSVDKENSRPIDKENSRPIIKENSRPINKENSRSSDKENPVLILTKLDHMRKSLQLVDPPFLAKGQGRGVSCSYKKIDRSIDKEKEASMTSEQRSPQANADKILLTKKQSEPKLTTKQKKELALKAKQEENLRMRAQKLRRMKNKWADCLPPRKKPAGPPLTREAKEEIKNDRKEKLKKIADEKKSVAECSDATRVKRPIIKAKAKVTEKSRNDFLVNEMQDRHVKQFVNSERSSLPNDTKSLEGDNRKVKSSEVRRKTLVNGEQPPITRCDKSSKGAREQDESLNMENVSLANDETSVNNSSIMKQIAQELKSSLVIEPRSEKSVRPKKGETSTNAIVKVNEIQKSSAMVVDEPKLLPEALLKKDFLAMESSSAVSDPRTDAGQALKSSLKKQSVKATNGNRHTKVAKVSFKELLINVQYYEIDPGNTLNKCPTKDAPVQAKKPSKLAKTERAVCPKLEEFLLNIFRWNPAWLQEQKQFGTMPPVVDDKKLVPMLSRYGTYEDYYNVTEPLLALELWYGITKDFNASEKHSITPVMSSIVNNSIGLTTVTSLKREVRVTTLLLEVVVSKRDADLNAHPVFGDLILFTYVSNRKGKQTFCTIFAYVTSLKQTVITPFTYFNRDLLKCVKEPYAVLTYTVMTKPLDPTHIQTNRAHRLRKISYLRSNMRMIQALQYLPISPLLNQILSPKIEDYQLPPMNATDSYPLVTKDKLNAKQLEAVVKITNTVVQKLSKICLIHGPPGTGKTKVIVNLVTEILYGGGRYQNKKMRILVCAPSNAAIDEIVLRLLDVRRKIAGNEKRFRMVRIGRIETMHPSAKNVSLQELAKREAKRTTENYLSPSLSPESIKEEKNFLEARINSLQLELTSARNVGAMNTSYIMRKLSDINAKYDLLMNRRTVETMEPRELSKLQRGAENTLLAGADVIACTLTSCYTNLMETTFADSGETISVCIVDEATQCAEAETLIPLMLGARTLVLVGDTNQLPATIISQKAKQYGLDQSLFARIQRSFTSQNNNPIILLNTQYRMSYPVAFWPNRFFYAGALRNAANLRNLPFHFYKVINLDSTQDTDKFSNSDEATFVANLFYTIMARSNLDNAILPVKVGIITPYNNQKTLITKKIKDRVAPLPDKVKKRFLYEVNTVDSFQGQERDLIIMSCVRSNGIGFLSDQQRLCVALTRAKHSLILCGNFKTFERDPMWHSLLSDAISRGVYVNIKATAAPEEIRPLVVR